MNVTSTSSLAKIQRSILARAAERTDGACLRPKRISQKAAREAVEALLSLKHVRTVKATEGVPAWHTDAAGRSVNVLISKRGRDALHSGQAFQAPFVSSPSTITADHLPRSGSKLAQVIQLISRDTGASLPELMTLTGWLPHTMRAVMTGLRKQGYTVARERGEDAVAVYRIPAAPTPIELS